MHQRLRFALCAILLLASNCQRGDAPPTAPRLPGAGVQYAIVDAAHGSGTPFYWLQPTVPIAPVVTGLFDATLVDKLSIEICELAETACRLPLVTTITSTSAVFASRIRVDAVRGHYLAYWNSALNDVSSDKFYRATVKQGTTILGSIDIDVVPLHADLSGVNTALYLGIARGEQATLRFRVEQVHFADPTYTLTLVATGGAITADPSGPKYPPGTGVTLHEQPAPGWSFNHWSGACSGTAELCHVTMDADKTAVANFDELPPPIVRIISKNGGDKQTAVVGSILPTSPSVIVRDAANTPMGGVPVSFDVLEGGGTVLTKVVTTDTHGVAATTWTLGTTSGSNSLTATLPGADGSPVTFTATGTAGPSKFIAINAGDNQRVTAHKLVPIQPSVIVTDANGNPKSGVIVRFVVGSGGGTCCSGFTSEIDATNALGIATLSSWGLGVAPGPNTLIATDLASGSSVTFHATGMPLTMSVYQGDNQSATVGTAVPILPSVIVRDFTGAPVGGVSVTFAVASGGGKCCAGFTSQFATTDANGIATVAGWVLGAPAPGKNTLMAVNEGLVGSPITFTATGTPMIIELVAGNNQTVGFCDSLPVRPAVRVTDINGHPIQGYSLSFAPNLRPVTDPLTGTVANITVTTCSGFTNAFGTTDAQGIAKPCFWQEHLFLGVPGTWTMTVKDEWLVGSPIVFTATWGPRPCKE